MAPFLKKLPILALSGLSACLILAACSHEAGQRGVYGGVDGGVSVGR